MEKLRIAHIVGTPLFGGPDSLILSLFEQLDRSRFELFLIFIQGKHTINQLLVEKVRALGMTASSIATRGKINPVALNKIISFKRKNRIDILHSHGYKADVLAFLASRISPAKLVSTLHGWTERSARLKYYKRIDLTVVKNFDHLIAVSRPILEELLAAGISSSLITLVPNSIDITRLTERQTDVPSLKAGLGLNGSGPLIGMVGRLDKEKNPDLLLAALPRLAEEFPALRCLFLGEGALRGELEARAAELGVDSIAIFPGYREDVRDIIPLLEVVIFPSWREGIPIALLESMALKRSVIATRVGGMPDVLLDGENGYLINPGDTKELFRKVSHLLKDRNLRKFLGENAAALVRKDYSSRRMVNQIRGVYENLTQK